MEQGALSLTSHREQVTYDLPPKVFIFSVTSILNDFDNRFLGIFYFKCR